MQDLCATGSSPLTRGKPVARCSVSGGGWLIPAHAGKTSAGRNHPGPPWAHPHSRGENAPDAPSRGEPQGSSPLTQGKRHDPDHQSASTVLPRSHGENHARKVAKPGDKGSSPLTRGKRGVLLRALSGPGLIPAHAGKTCTAALRGPEHRVHPRSRVENPAAVVMSRVCPGSSPLTRENNMSNVFDVCSCGSSPLTRGKLVHHRHDGLRTRLIPAHAGKRVVVEEPLVGLGLIPTHTGKTRLPAYSYAWCRAHPRSRGENVRTPCAFSLPYGSSPLTRGKLRRCSGGDYHDGLIPAHAGIT